MSRSGPPGRQETPEPVPSPPPSAPADAQGPGEQDAGQRAPDQGRPAAVVVPAKTPIEVELLQNLNSAHDTTGGVVRFRIVDDVKAGDRLVVAGGAIVEGRIKYAERSRSNGRAGVLQVVIPSVRSVDGGRLPLWGEMVACGRNRSGASAATQVAVGVVGFAVHGRQATSQIGDRFTVYTRGEETVGPPAAAPDAPAPPLVPAWEFEAQASPLTIGYAVASGDLRETIAVEIPRHAEIDRLGSDSCALALLDGRPLEEPVHPASLRARKEGWTAYFDSWAVVRHLEGSPEGRAHEAALRIDLPGGRAALVRLPLTLKLE